MLLSEFSPSSFFTFKREKIHPLVIPYLGGGDGGIGGLSEWVGECLVTECVLLII